MRLKLNRKLIIGLILLGIVLLCILWGMIRPPFNPDTMDSTNRLSGVSIRHFCGTDQFGRDIFSRMLVGIRTTMWVALITNLISIVMGILIGALTGYFGGLFDEIIMRVNDAVLAFPSILLALVFVSVTSPGTYSVAIAMGIAFTPSYARIVRSVF